MNQKGIAPLIIVGIVVVVVVVACVGAYIVVSRSGGVLGTLPVYSGAQETNDNIAQQVITSCMTEMGSPSGWSSKAYTTQANPGDVIDWYKTQMSGWTKVTDNTVSLGGTTVYVLAYTKGNDTTGIVTFAYGNSNYLILLAGPNPTSGGGENQQGGQFSISVSPSSVTIPRGESGNVTVSYSPGVPFNLGMSSSSGYDKIQLNFSAPPFTYTVVVSGDAVPGSYTVTLEATDTDTGAEATTTFTVVVT